MMLRRYHPTDDDVNVDDGTDAEAETEAAKPKKAVSKPAVKRPAAKTTG